MNPIILPYMDCVQYTRDAIADVLTQTLPDLHLLLIDNGSGAEGRALGEEFAVQDPTRVLRWRHDPPLPSLSATWNHALRWAWESGAEHALVVNNDLRLHAATYETLWNVQDTTGAWLVSAVGVTAAQFDPRFDPMRLCTCPVKHHSWYACAGSWPKGGPDFSCFLITKECHRLYPFDEGFVPAFCEDLDMHRRLMLDGHGDKIFSVNLPYLHYASQTLKGMPPDKRTAHESRITAGSRAHYRLKWGGDVNQETYTRPFDPESAAEHVTTPELQHGQTT